MDEQHKTLLTSPSMPRYQSPETDEHNSYAQIIKVFPEIHQQFLEVLDDYQLTDPELYETHQLDERHIKDILAAMKLEYNAGEVTFIETLLKRELLGFGPLDALLSDDSVTDILVNRFDEVFVESEGQLKLTELKFYNDQHLMSIIHRILSLTNRRVDRLQPYSNARLPDGSRVNVVIPPASEQGPVVSIRRFAQHGMTMKAMIASGGMNKGIEKLLSLAIRCRFNVMITGGAGAGKTTLLNAIAQEIAVDERIVTIEDVSELRIEHPHLVTLESQTESLEGLGEVSMRDLFINALRMRPTRIIIGEVRGLEILEMLQAMNSGHDGSLTTLHASSAEDVPSRILNMVAMAGMNIPSSAILQQIINNIDLIIEVQHLSSGQRFVRRVCECVSNNEGQYQLSDIYSYQKHRILKGKPKVEYQNNKVSAHFKTRVDEFGLSKEMKGSGDDIF